MYLNAHMKINLSLSVSDLSYTVVKIRGIRSAETITAHFWKLHLIPCKFMSGDLAKLVLGVNTYTEKNPIPKFS